MKLRLAILVGGVLVLFGSAAQAAAQTPTPAAPAAAATSLLSDRIFVNVNVGSQTKAIQDDESFKFSLYGEDGTASFSREVKGGIFPDVMVGIRVKNNFFIALQGSVRTASADSPSVASVPDPIAFESPRIVTGTLAAMAHRELWASVLPTVVIPVRKNVDVMLFGGASLVELEHEIASFSPTGIVEPGPTVTFTRVTESRSVWGFLIGADARYMFTDTVGAGAFVRFQRASVNFPGTGLTLDVGGLQAGAGLRFRF
jgi:hypothetical protein